MKKKSAMAQRTNGPQKERGWMKKNIKILSCDQRSIEWYAARLGIPTASSFGKLVARTGKARTGKTPESYKLSLLAERLTRTPTGGFSTAAMDRGRELEEHARAWYEQKTGRTVRQIGFATDESSRWGCSPDGIAERRGLEIKCPMLPGFMEFATYGIIPDDHYIQMQACMWIFGLKIWDYVVFTDVRGLLPIITPVNADPALHSAFDEILPSVCDDLDANEVLLRKAGNGVHPETPIDLSAILGEPTDEQIEAMEEIKIGDL